MSGGKTVEIYSRERSSSIETILRWEQERQSRRKAWDGKDETPGDKENGIKDRSKILKYQKPCRESGSKGNKGRG